MKTIHLQGIGKRPATEAKNIKKGDTLIWNFGWTSKVIDILKETEKTLVILTQSETGYIAERRLNKERLVAIA